MLRAPASAYLSVEMSAKRGGSLLIVGAAGVLALLGLSALLNDGPRHAQPYQLRGIKVVAGTQNEITWEGPPTGNFTFRVYRSSEATGTYDLLGVTPGRSFFDEPVSRGIYWYRVAAVPGAGEEGPRSPPVSSDRVSLSAIVGPAGGTLAPTTGTVRLDIPAGAVAVPTTFTIDQLPSPPAASAGRVLVTRAFEIGPSGLDFRTPATLTLAFELPAGSGPKSVHDGTLAAQFWKQEAERWARLRGGRVDAAASTVTARIPHLSLWAVGSLAVPHGGYSSTTDMCKTCHDWHDAKSGSSLLSKANERELCYSCHDGTGASTDIRSEFGESSIGSSTKVSFHPVPQKTDNRQLVCSDCHSSHKPLAEDTKLLGIQDGVDADGNPAWLYSPPNTPIGNAFCYGCHGASSTLPPKFQGFERFKSSPHKAIVTEPNNPAAIQCLACHQPHGSDFPSLLKDDTPALCVTCHDGTTASSFDMTSWANSGHATIGGLVCEDCHDSHGTTNASMLRELGGATGYDGTTATWSQLQLFCTACHAEPPVGPGTTVDHTTVDTTQQLCTDCHSHASSPF